MNPDQANEPEDLGGISYRLSSIEADVYTPPSDFSEDIQRIGEVFGVIAGRIGSIVTDAHFIAALTQLHDSIDQAQWLLFAQCLEVEKEGRYWSEDKRVLYLTGRFSPEDIDNLSDDDLPMLPQLSSLLPHSAPIDSFGETADQIIKIAARTPNREDARRQSREDVQKKRREMRRGKK